MLCKYLKFVTCDDGRSPYEVWVCTQGLDEGAPLDLGKATFCTLKDMKPCLYEYGPFGSDTGPASLPQKRVR
jgi:hypothetical protein